MSFWTHFWTVMNALCAIGGLVLSFVFLIEREWLPANIIFFCSCFNALVVIKLIWEANE